MGDAVQVYDQAGTLVVAINLCRSAYYTVVKFSWRSRKYRYLSELICEYFLTPVHAVMLVITMPCHSPTCLAACVRVDFVA